MRITTAIAAGLIGLCSVAASAQETVRPVKLTVLEAQQDVLEREFFGRVVARQTVDLAFQVSGQIVRLPIVEGERIEKGKLIAQLDLEPFQLSLEQAQLQLEQAQRDLARKEQLGANTVSQVTIDDAQTAAGLARVAARNAQYSLDQATLNAPFDALIASRKIEQFSTVSSGTAIARVHDMSELRVEIDVPEILFRQARDGRGVELLAAIPESDLTIPLEFREFNAETSAVGQTYAITLGMTPPEGSNILPGASVSVIAKRKVGDNKIVLPRTAIVIDPDKSTHLMQFQPAGAAEGTVRKIAVEVETDDNGFLVLKSGLDAGSEIVAAGASGLTDGEAVRRFDGF